MNKGSIVLIAAIILLAGCGQAAQTPDKQPEQKVFGDIKTPLVGIVNGLGEKSFTLVTLPEKLEDQPGRSLVDFSNAPVVDAKGKDAKLSNDATVSVTGKYGSENIVADKVVVISTPSTGGVSLKMDSDLTIVTAGKIEKLLGLKVPKSFANNWKLENTGSLQNIPTSRIYQYVKDEWKLILVENPKTPEKYEITLYGPEKFVWVGSEDIDGNLKATNK